MSFFINYTQVTLLHKHIHMKWHTPKPNHLFLACHVLMYCCQTHVELSIIKINKSLKLEQNIDLRISLRNLRLKKVGTGLALIWAQRHKRFDWLLDLYWITKQSGPTKMWLGFEHKYKGWLDCWVIRVTSYKPNNHVQCLQLAVGFTEWFHSNHFVWLWE